MGRIIDAVRAINSFLWTVLLVAGLTAVGTAGYFVYEKYFQAHRQLERQAVELEQARSELSDLKAKLADRDRQVAAMEKLLKEKQERIERLELARTLLTTDQRLARLHVIDVDYDEDGNATSCTVEFKELNPAGEPIGEPKRFKLEGDVVYIDNWIVKFDDQFIEQADLERGTSLCLFRRIFGENQMPSEGFPLDEVGMRPQAYARGGVMSEFEKRLWAEFWEFANDPEKAAAMGIRAANGEAVSIKVREGMAYNLILRNSGGLSIQPIGSSGKES